MGKASNARSVPSRQPNSANTAMSRASVAGSHDTYATRRRAGRGAGRRRVAMGPVSSRSMTRRDAPVLGGSRTASRGRGQPPRASSRATSPAYTRAQGVSRRLYRASRTAARSASTPMTAPSGPTRAASAPANSPAPQNRSSATSPGRGRSVPSTASVSVSAAPGWTCQNAPALTRHERPAACCWSGPGAASEGVRSTARSPAAGDTTTSTDVASHRRLVTSAASTRGCAIGQSPMSITL